MHDKPIDHVYYYSLSCGLALVFLVHVKQMLFYSWSTFTCRT